MSSRFRKNQKVICISTDMVISPSSLRLGEHYTLLESGSHSDLLHFRELKDGWYGWRFITKYEADIINKDVERVLL